MRITQSMMTRRYLSNLNSAMSNMSRSNQRIASGRNYEHLSENVSAGIKSVRVRENISTSDMYLDAMKSADNELSSAETNLMSISSILQSVKEKVIKAQNTVTLSASDRKTIASEIDNLKDEILKTANAQFDDKYLFGATNSGSSPFTVGDDGVVLFNGFDTAKIQKNEDTGEYYVPDPADPTDETKWTVVAHSEKKYLDIGLGMSIGSDGKVDPNTAFEYSFAGIDILGFGVDEDGSEKNVIAFLNNVSKAIAPEEDGGVFDSNKLGKLADKLSDRTDTLLEGITEIGTRTNFIEATTTRTENDILNMKALHKRLYEVDEATEITNEKMYEFSWNAILNMGSKIIPNSLMDYIR